MKRNSFVLLFSIYTTLLLFAQPYNFEDGNIPTGWSSEQGGKLSISTDKYKLGKRSLRWDWVKGSTLIVDTPQRLDVASRSSSGGINLYLYNTERNTAPLTFKFLNNTDTKCSKSYHLNFEGWRAFWCSFVSDMGHKRGLLTQMRIEAPAEGNSGTIYFDFLEFQPTVSWARMSDLQYTVKQSPSQEKFLEMYQKQLPPLNKEVTPAEESAIQLIEQRVDEWFLGNGSFSDDPTFKSRKKSITNWINRSKKALPQLTKGKDGVVTGDGLFSMTYPIKVDGETPSLFQDISSSLMIPLAYDIRLNQSKESRQQLIDLYDWFHDQGWAEGSALGTLYMEKLRSGGYFQSIFLARTILDEKRLNRELQTLKWFSLFGSAIERKTDGETADNFRTLLMPKLYYALMQPKANDRVAAMRQFASYCQKAFQPVEGFIGTFKPDLMGYHHQGTYLGAYYPTALYTASWVAYLLRDTPYALPQETLSFLKKATLEFQNFCAGYDAPSSANGRFPGETAVLHKVLFGIPYLCSAMGGDKELEAMIARLWNTNEPLVKEYIESVQTNITFNGSLGEIDALLQSLTANVQPKPIEPFSGFYPYGGIGAYRSDKHLLTLKGASKFIWDFEGGSRKENTLGRYLSNGMIELTDLTNRRKNPCIPSKNDDDLDAIFDWNRLTGATTIELSNDELHYQKGGKNQHRNFTDQSFLGGVNLDRQNALFGLSFHDITYDPSFGFKQSVVRIGEAFICLGSSIQNSNELRPTQTTLFQTELKANESIRNGNTIVSSDTKGLIKPTLTDNLGSSYIVLEGKVMVNFKTKKERKVASAVIEHGNAPQNSRFAYILLPNGTDKTVKEWNNKKNNISILQQDEQAHILTHKATQTTAISLFDSSLSPKETIVKQANAPSLILYQGNKTGYRIAISDPDMRRSSAAGINGLNEKIKRERSQDFAYELILNGTFQSNDLPNGFSLSIQNGLTTISGNVREGRCYSFSILGEK